VDHDLAVCKIAPIDSCLSLDLNPKIHFLIHDVNVVFATFIRTTHTKHQPTKKYEAYNRRTSLSIQILGRLGTNHRRK
jgi:hypothetical protein